MAQMIEIVGGMVRLVDHTVHREMLLEDFKAQLFTVKPFSTPRLPVKCSFVIGTNTNIVAYVVERPPGVQHMVLHNKEGGIYDEETDTYRYVDNEEYEVAVPWQYWVIITTHDKPTVRSGQIPVWPVRGILYVWSTEQLESIEQDTIVRAYVPNTNGATHFCMGRTDYDPETLDGLIDGIVDTWWDVPFNTDLGRNVPPGFNSIQEWDESGRAPVFDDAEQRYNLASLVQYAGGYEPIDEPKGLAPFGDGRWGVANLSEFTEWVTKLEPYAMAQLKGQIDAEWNYQREKEAEEARRQNNEWLAKRAEERRATALRAAETRRLREEQRRRESPPPVEDTGLNDFILGADMAAATNIARNTATMTDEEFDELVTEGIAGVPAIEEDPGVHGQAEEI
jgi:hypothetical protein